MEPKFFNKNGTLTNYALSCGYVEKKESEQIVKRMFVEHGHIHVQMFNKKLLYRELWEVFERDQLTKARKLFNSIKLC